MNQVPITTIQAVDPVFVFILGACAVLLVAIAAAMIWFAVRYHRSRAPEPTSQCDGNAWLEVAWTALPTLLVLAMFYYGWSGYLTLRDVPKGALQATAVGRMWSWSFHYANGKTSDKLFVPVGKPIQVNLESRDVIHGFYMPSFRIKRDAVPGMKNHVWFIATKPGSYDIFCSQYCGTGHSAMITTAEAIPEAEFQAWLNQDQKRAAHPGLAVLEKHGCLGCHSLDGSKKVGPTFQGLYGSKVSVTRAGKAVVVEADEAYLHESIVIPSAAIVAGYPPIMPPPAGLTEAELKTVIDYLKTLEGH